MKSCAASRSRHHQVHLRQPETASSIHTAAVASWCGQKQLHLAVEDESNGRRHLAEHQTAGGHTEVGDATATHTFLAKHGVARSSETHLLCDGMGRLDDLWRNPGQGAALAGDVADIGVALLLGQPEVGHLAHRAPIAVAQQQVGALQVKMHNALLVQVFHALQAGMPQLGQCDGVLPFKATAASGASVNENWFSRQRQMQRLCTLCIHCAGW